jgi:hypothetical protein
MSGNAADGHAVPAIVEGNLILLDLQRSLWRLSALVGLVKLGVPEQLSDGPLSLAELADRCGAQAPLLARALRCIVQTGLIRRTSTGEYELAEAGQALLRGMHPPVLRLDSDPQIWGALAEVTETIRAGQAPFIARNGSFYRYIGTRPELSEVFDEFMAALHAPIAAALAHQAAFRDMRTLVDVGGGEGMFLTAILRANPGLHGVLLELERSVPAAKQYLEANGVADRCEVVAGDFFTSVPVGADGYLLAHVIHNWNDEHAAAILRAVRAGAGDVGQVMLVETILPDDDSSHPGKDRDMRLLSLFEGSERSYSEYSALLGDTGWRPGSVTELFAGSCLMTASPVG